MKKNILLVALFAASVITLRADITFVCEHEAQCTGTCSYSTCDGCGMTDGKGCNGKTGNTTGNECACVQ